MNVLGYERLEFNVRCVTAQLNVYSPHLEVCRYSYYLSITTGGWL